MCGCDCLRGNRSNKRLRYALLAVALVLLQLVFIAGCRPERMPARKNKPGVSTDPAILTLQDPGSRVLVIAPHPDDESIAAAGIMLRAVKEHKAVKVVVITDGDRFIWAARLLTDKEKITPEDLAYLGRVRRQESLRALGLLGVNSNQVQFLGYHDRSLISLWSQYQANKGDSPGTGLALTLNKIIGDWQPTDIYYPSGEDEHPDHSAASQFVKAVLAARGSSLREHQYLVHYDKNRWPAYSLRAPHGRLTPPISLLTRGYTWEQFPLQPSEIGIKASAIRQYRTQLRAVGGRYLTYVRSNELFIRS